MSKPITWSYSSLALYQQCPKKYYHLKVVKDIKEPLSEAITFGNEIHKIALLILFTVQPGPCLSITSGFVFTKCWFTPIFIMRSPLPPYVQSVVQSTEQCVSRCIG